jgi:hypothetical protein
LSSLPKSLFDIGQHRTEVSGFTASGEIEPIVAARSVDTIQIAMDFISGPRTVEHEQVEGQEGGLQQASKRGFRSLSVLIDLWSIYDYIGPRGKL